MTKRYKIHPAIGIARLGNSPDAFFVAAEKPGGLGIELAANGSEAAVSAYKQKDDNGQLRIKRQGARFRVFEYEVDQTGMESLRGEVTPDMATVTWSVQLANTKAAGNQILGGGVQPRNPGIPSAQLEIRPVFTPLSGINQRSAESTVGQFKNLPVSLGELRTDGQGRLIVLGGFGNSESVPAGRPINSFANNPDWHDDVSDGPVDAEIVFLDGRKENAIGAWVIVAPPDFAPGIQGIATLYDVARSAAVSRGWITKPTIPSYSQEILPILQRVAQLRWVNQFAVWNSYSRDWSGLGDPANAQARSGAYAMLMDVEQSGTLNNFEYTDLQREMLALWANGTFTADFGLPVMPMDPAAALDRAALDQTVGGGFFPGIEAGVLMTNAQIYAEPFRLTRGQFADSGGLMALGPGSITQRMALPWQADFLKCSGQWWPAQRPDKVFVNDGDTEPSASWIEGIASHRDLCSRFWKLGFVIPVTVAGGAVMQLERERAVDMPHGGA
jgi:hypothetical protein